MDDIHASIRKYFTVETAPRQSDKWLIVCEKCDSMWHLPKGDKHVGNVLHLLNHALGHDVKRPKGKRKLAALAALNEAGE